MLAQASSKVSIPPGSVEMTKSSKPASMIVDKLWVLPLPGGPIKRTLGVCRVFVILTLWQRVGSVSETLHTFFESEF